MRDPMSFEASLQEAFERYAAAAPVHVDPLQLVADLARGGHARPRRSGLIGGPLAARLALVGLLALSAMAGLLLAGSLLRDPTPLGAGGRLLVWMPDGNSPGTAWRLDAADGAVRGRLDLDPHSGCPTLLDGVDAVAASGFRIVVRAFDGTLLDEISTSYEGFEHWSVARDAIALMETGKLTARESFDRRTIAGTSVRVVHVQGGAYGVAFPSDGSRRELYVKPGEGNTVALDVHDDAGGQIIATLATDDPYTMAGTAAWSPTGGRIAVATLADGRWSLSLVSIDGGVESIGWPEVAPGAGPKAIVWARDETGIALVSAAGDIALVDPRRGRWTTLPGGPFAPTVEVRWSPHPSHQGLAVRDGASVHVVGADGRRLSEIVLPGDVAAFAPDGSALVAVAATEPLSGVATVWLIDPWRRAEPVALAELPRPDTRSEAVPCIQWLEEVDP